MSTPLESTPSKGVAEMPAVDGSSLSVGIVVSRFNAAITENLLVGARDELARHHVLKTNIDVRTVSGAYEIPLILKALAATYRYQLLIALGCVIRGETPHFDYVCNEAVSGTTRVMLDYSIPIGLGLLTCDTMAQAEARAGIDADQSRSNKGAEAAQAALESWFVLNAVQ